MQEEKIIRMKCGDAPIQIDNKKTVSFHATSSYDKNLTSATFTWHMIIVHHRGKYSKRDILNALFATVGDNEFYPVAYKEYDLRDEFLIRQCRGAIQRLFDKNLTLTMPMSNVSLTVNFNVAEYNVGQVYAAKRIEMAITQQFNKLETVEDVANVLNLDRFTLHPELADIIINLSNRPALELLCKMIAQNHDILNTINGLKLSNNNIATLAPFSVFNKVKLQMVDLRFNNIKQINQLKHLKGIQVTELYIAGNPITNNRDYLEQIKETLPNLLKVDGVYTKRGSAGQSGSSDGIEMIFEGDLISGRDRVNFKKYKGSDMWNYVTIEHKGNYTKAEIIDALFATFAHQINDFYPCYYKVGSEVDSFFVRNAYEQLECLYCNGLAIKIVGTEDYLPITLRMNVANFRTGHVEPNDVLMEAASERFNLMDRLLNLENFSSSSAFKNLTISLGSSRTLTALLLQCARRYLTNVVELRLGSNDIISGKGMHPLNWMKNLKVLDLSNNRIENISDLESIPKGTIKELRLDGNPLCRKFTFPGDYIKEVKKIFPELIKLDGVVISNEGSIAMQKNYLCSIEAYDFVEEFIKTYFKTYDTPQRAQLSDMYHRNAIFSISVQYDQAKINAHNSTRIQKYNSMSRNLLKMSNFSRAYTSMFNGRDEIATALKQLPPSEHDYFSFTIDTTIFTRQLICITVTGVFQELGSSLLENDMLFSFCRTFILHPNATDLGFFQSTTEYKIVNEQFFISNPTVWQAKNSFKYSKPADKYAIEANSAEEKESFIIIFQQMTGLKSIWCTRCLEDGKWNFRSALQKFIDLLNKNQIPPTSFIEGQQLI